MLPLLKPSRWCLDENLLARYLEGGLPPAERRQAEAHLASCSGCFAAVGALGRVYGSSFHDAEPPASRTMRTRSDNGREARPMPVLVPGTSVGRYVVLELVGEGGMGMVYAAHDPELRRRVALKLLGAADGDDASQVVREWLLREARLMAKLAHPNVVAVYDVGLFEDRVFVAMEYVEGETLRSWTTSAERRSVDVLTVLVQAGEGLAAAHRAGLVHRDFKPDNVLVGADGRTRVTDFGLARRTDRGVARTAGDPIVGAAAANVTRPRGVLGTPAYMAPEQRAGSDAGPSSDQFAFCVTMHEVLTGSRPGADPAAGLHKLPRWLRAVLRRGLSQEASDRFPSMEALLETLRRDRAARRRRFAFALAAGAVALAASAAAAAVSSREAARTRSKLVCSGAERKLDGVWDADRRAALERSFLATGAPFAKDAWAAVATSLDGYSRAWVSGHTEACVATRIRGEQSDEILTRRMQCLDDRLRELGALTTAFASADADVVAKAPAASGRMSSLADCADLQALASFGALPPAASARAEVDDVRGKLAAVRAIERAGKFEAGFVVAHDLAGRAKAIGYRPLEAEALALEATLQEERANVVGAEATWMQAIDAGEAGHHDVLVAEAWPMVIRETARLARFDDARRAIPRARAAFERVGRIGAATYLLPEGEGVLAFEQGRYGEAAELYRTALAGRERLDGPRSLGAAAAAAHLGDALRHLGKQDEAVAAYERSLAVREELLGGHHPDLAESLDGLAMAYDRLGRYSDARRLLERAIAILEEAFGPDHPSLAEHLNNLALAMRDDGETTAVIPLLERTARLTIASKGAAHPDVATAYSSLGLAYQATGDLARARTYHEQALAIRTAALGPDHPRVAISLYQLGEVAFASHDLGRAVKSYTESLAVDERALGPKDAHLAFALVGLARTELALHHADRALSLAERAVELRSARAGRPRELGDAQFTLARALSDSHKDHPRARKMAEDALANYQRDGRLGEKQTAEVTRWLSHH